MKKILSCVMFLCLCLLLTGCQSEPEPLRICIDLYNPWSSSDNRELVAQNYVEYVADIASMSGGPTEIELDYIPAEGTERENALDRIRTEIMAGGGPDVFIISIRESRMTDEEDLFPVPEKAMESGIFLPLDEYMENCTQFAEWDKLTSVVMEAGRNEEGQLILPLAYYFPLTYYRNGDISVDTSKETTWQDMLADDTKVLTAAAGWYHPSNSDIHLANFERGYIDFALGELADFEEEELLFSEDELLQRTNEVLGLIDQYESGALSEVPDHFQDILNFEFMDFDWPFDRYGGIYREEELTMVPIYSDDGGTTALICCYGAININTKRPEDAFFVLDLLLKKEIQDTSQMFKGMIWCRALPMHEDLAQNAFRKNGADDTVSYGEFCKVRDQITCARFENSLTNELKSMFAECYDAYRTGADYTEIVSESYQAMKRLLGE